MVGWGQALGRGLGATGWGRQGTGWNLALILQRADRRHGRKSRLCVKMGSLLLALLSLRGPQANQQGCREQGATCLEVRKGYKWREACASPASSVCALLQTPALTPGRAM